jgi:hypothetical protein
MLSLLLSPIYRIGAIVLAVLSAIAVIYGKGRSDASASSKIKAYKETQDAIEKASRARERVANAPAERLRDNDGFRRD